MKFALVQVVMKLILLILFSNFNVSIIPSWLKIQGMNATLKHSTTPYSFVLSSCLFQLAHPSPYNAIEYDVWSKPPFINDQ